MAMLPVVGIVGYGTVGLEVTLDAEKFRRVLEKEAEGVLDSLLSNVAERIARRARELVPVDTGKLFASIRVEPFGGVSDGGYVVIAGHSSGGVDYAIPVHQRLDLHHDRGQALFVEAAVEQVVESFSGDEFA